MTPVALPLPTEVLTLPLKATGLFREHTPTVCSLKVSFCTSNTLREYFFCFID